jgi:hypothetical protein
LISVFPACFRRRRSTPRGLPSTSETMPVAPETAAMVSLAPEP